jgi:hypothetical protein
MMKGRAGLLGLLGLVASAADGPKGGGISPRPMASPRRGTSTLTGPERKDRKAKNKRAAKARKVSRRAR